METPFDELITTFEALRQEFIALREERDGLKREATKVTIACDRLAPLIGASAPDWMMIELAADMLERLEGSLPESTLMIEDGAGDG